MFYEWASLLRQDLSGNQTIISCSNLKAPKKLGCQLSVLSRAPRCPSNARLLVQRSGKQLHYGKVLVFGILKTKEANTPHPQSVGVVQTMQKFCTQGNELFPDAQRGTRELWEMQASKPEKVLCWVLV